MIYYFVYETTNLVNGKKYRGIHKTTNLDDGYIGSGIALNNAIGKYGKENFTREIFEFCNSYDELLEREKVYVDEDWVRDHSNYNLKTGGQSSGILSDESKQRISETLKRRYENGEIVATGRPIGTIPWNKGVRFTKEEKETYNYQKVSDAQKEKYLSDSHPFKTTAHKEPWNKGIETGPQSEEVKEKKSKTLKERYKNQEHHSKGKDPWNKGKKGVQEAWNKGKEMEKTECPHCSKLVDIGNGRRWHFDNCKLKNV